VNKLVIKFGVELEAGWDMYVRSDDFRGEFSDCVCEVKSDGSLRLYSDNQNITAREITTRVFKYDSEDFSKFCGFLKSVSKYIREVNNSMGYHVHLSFWNSDGRLNRTAYLITTTREFIIDFRKHLKKKFSDVMERRLKNKYSYDIKNIRKFVKHDLLGDRYHFINYNNFFGRKTIEIRCFEMTKDYNKLIEYTRETIEFFRQYIEKRFGSTFFNVKTAIRW